MNANHLNQPVRDSEPRGLRGLLLTGFGLSLLLPILFAALVWYDLDRESVYAARRARIVAQAVQRQLGEQMSWLADELQQRVESAALPPAGNTASGPPGSRRQSELDAAIHDDVLVHAGNTTDPQGRRVDASWLPPPDPDALPSGLSIGAPIRDAASGRIVVPVAWDGQSGWRIGARVDADWFASALAGYDLGADSELSLLHRDHVLFARSQDNQRYAGMRLDKALVFDDAHRNLTTGQYMESRVIDGARRLFVFRRVPHSPLIVVVANVPSDALAGWRRFAAFAVGGSLLLGALWFWLSRAFARSHARQAQLLADLRRQSARGEEARRIASLGDWIWNLDTGEVAWSDEIFAIYGLPMRTGGLRIDEIPEWVHPDDRARLRGYLDQALANGEPVETEFRIVRPDGVVRVVRARGEWVDRTPGQRLLRGIQQDVTELAVTRERLRATQDEYRFMFKNNPLPACVYDRETLKFLAVNKALLAVYGYTREEFLARTVLDIRPADEVEDARTRLMNPEYPQGKVWTHARKDGARLRMKIHGSEIEFDGHPARLVVLQDVTESEAAEQRFQLVARATSDVIWDWDVQSGAIWRSDSLYPVFGYSRDDIAPTQQAWDDLLHPDDREHAMASLKQAIESDATEWECTYLFRRKDGGYASVLDRAILLRDERGRVIRAVGGMLDVGQKLQDEADLRLLRRAVESTANGIVITDAHQPDNPVVYVNHGFEELTGFRGEQLIGRNCRVLQGEDRDQPGLDTLRRAMREGSEAQVLLRNYRADGTMFWNEFHLAPVRNEYGELTHFIGILNDVTERQRSEERFQLVARATSDAVWDWDLQTDVTWRSDNVYPLFGYERNEIGGTLQGWSMLLHPDDRERVITSVRAGIDSGASEWECNYRFLRKDGNYADVLDRGFIMRDRNGVAVRAVGGMLDVTEKHKAEADLRLLRRAMESADNGIAIADARQPGLPMVYVNRAYEKMTGSNRAELIGSPCRFLQEGAENQPEISAIRQAIAEQRELRVLLHDQRKSGESFWNDFYLAPVRDDNGVLTHFVSIQTDVSERQRILDQLAYRATYDELTGLPNRQLLADRLQQAVLNAERHQRSVGVLFVDLDEFKLINDTLGHSAGDQALRTVAQRFAGAVRGSDTVGRFGGDEFVAILTEQTDEDGVGRVIERFSAALAQPVDIAGVPHYISASIGYCRYPEAGRDAETLLKHADMAMYQAKQQGRNRAVAYRAEFDAGISERLHMVSALRDALQREEFRLVFQPLFGREGNPVGMEALLRWQHPQRGLLAPGHFIGLCEDSGLIVPIGRWVLNEAARHHALLAAKGLGHLRIAVNVSAMQFQQSLYGDVQEAIAAHALPHGALELELTESVIMDDPEMAIEVMRRIDKLGVSISVDDFGTGYSSLAYLKRLPIDRLKIDRSFVDQLGQDTDDDAICTSIIGLAHSLGLRTVAEGVETQQQLEWLRARGCDELQGFLLGRPLPFDEMLLAIGSG